MSSEELDRRRRQLWRLFAWIGMAGCLAALACALLYSKGYIDAATKKRFAVIGATIFFGLNLLVGFVTLEMPIRDYRLQFERRPMLFLLWFAVCVFFFLFYLWHSLGLDRWK